MLAIEAITACIGMVPTLIVQCGQSICLRYVHCH